MFSLDVFFNSSFLIDNSFSTSDIFLINLSLENVPSIAKSSILSFLASNSSISFLIIFITLWFDSSLSFTNSLTLFSNSLSTLYAGSKRLR